MAYVTPKKRIFVWYSLNISDAILIVYFSFMENENVINPHVLEITIAQ